MRQTVRKTGILMGSVVLLVLAAGAAWAAPQMGHSRGPMGKDFDHGFMMGRMMADLDLDEGQKQALHEQMQANHQEMAPVMEQRDAARQALAQAIHAPDFDEAAIRAAAAETAVVEGDLAVARAQMLRQVRDLLTPQQQEKLETLLSEHLAEMGELGSMKKRHHQGFGGGHGHGGGESDRS